MRKATDIIPGIALFLAGMAGCVLTNVLVLNEGKAILKGEAAGTGEEPPAVLVMPAAMGQEAALAERIGRLEVRLHAYAHTAKLTEVPSTSPIVSVMELSKTMTSLDKPLTALAHSIELLKAAVSQKDSLQERVPQSPDSLQNYSDNSEVPEDVLFSRAA